MSLKGTSIPNITYALPDYICWSDTSSFGLGGFNHEGLAWQWEIPENLRFRVSINVLEFIASVITIMLTLERKEKDRKILAFTDNSSALGWLYKASFHPATQTSHDKIARKFAHFMMKQEHSLYSEHIKGDSNNIADALSQEFSLPKNKLTRILYHSYPTQMPQKFQIIDLPKKLDSWISSTLEEETVKKELKNNRPRNQSHTFKNGSNSATKQESKTDSYKTYPSQEKLRSYAPSQPQYEGISLERLQRKYCSGNPLETQSDMFVRISGLTDSAIQALMSQE